jgi:general secretion pathway protein H
MDCRRDPLRISRMRRLSGFTLLELLVVLVLLTAVTALVAPAFLKTGGVELQAAARNLAAGLRRARSQAIQTNTVTAMSVDVERKDFSLSFEGGRRKLPEVIELTLYTARSAVESESRGAIRFFPDGGSTGGRITVKRGPRQIHVDVDWLGGRVRLLDDSSGRDRVASR